MFRGKSLIKTTREDLMEVALSYYKFASTTKWVTRDCQATCKKSQKIYLKCIACGKSRFPDAKSAKKLGPESSVNWCEGCASQFYRVWERVELSPNPNQFWEKYRSQILKYDYWEKA